VETHAPEIVAPAVRVLPVTPESVQLTVRTQGSVAPRTESDLVPEVGGRVVWVSPALAAGGFFEEGEPLLRLDRADHEVKLLRAEAALASARSQAELARRNQDRSVRLQQDGLIAATTHEDAQNTSRVAAASLRDADAALAQARRDLDRTELRAPFAGRVREKRVDVGQFVERGTPAARLYAVDYAEVRLPVTDADLAFLDLALDHRGSDAPARGPGVVLSARFAGADHRWKARVVRTEGEIDPRSRLVHVVARVDDPYGRPGNGEGRPPLAVGMFVDAAILGRTVDAAIVLPRAALRGEDRVLVVDAQDRLTWRRVTVLRADRDTVIVGAGLQQGERVVLSPLEAPVEGMPVRPVLETTS
jgi:RND family efflux transporter MFP subunit